MTALPLHRRTPAPPVNDGDTYCHMCWTHPGDQHTSRCPETTHANRPRLAYPAEARIFRGGVNALILVAPFWLAGIAFLIWSN